MSISFEVSNVTESKEQRYCLKLPELPVSLSPKNQAELAKVK